MQPFPENISKLLIALYFCVLPHCNASLTWNEDIYQPKTSKAVVRKLGDDLTHRVKHFGNATPPNLAIAYMRIKSNHPGAREFTIQIPHFFLSGWNQQSYDEKIGRDIGIFLKNLINDRYPRYKGYSVRTLSAFFNRTKEDPDGREGFKDFLKSMGIGTDKLQGENFEKEFFHTEQAIFQYVMQQAQRIIRFLYHGTDSERLYEIDTHILSYNKICAQCKRIPTLYKKHLDELFNEEKMRFNFYLEAVERLPSPPEMISPSQSSPNKRKLSDRDKDEDEEEEEEDASTGCSGEKARKVEDSSDNIDFRAIVGGLEESNPCPEFIGALVPNNKTWKVIREPLLANKVPDLQYMNNHIIMNKRDLDNPDNIIIASFVRAYVNIYLDPENNKTNNRSINRSIASNMEEIPDLIQKLNWNKIRKVFGLEPEDEYQKRIARYKKYDIAREKINLYLKSRGFEI